MVYHILNGDALTDRFLATGLPGEVIVAREAFIDGDLSGDTLQEFWKVRAKNWNETFENYKTKVADEYEKILQAPADSEFNLWFEYDLFCQVNLWFTLHLLHSSGKSKNVYAVYSSHLSKEDPNFWSSYGSATPEDLKTCFTQRTALTEADFNFGNELWLAYKNADFEKLTELAKQPKPAFPYLQDVVQAHIARFPSTGEPGRPEKAIRDILNYSSQDFNTVFAVFQKRERIYGFGDLQVKQLYAKVLRDSKR